VMIPAGLRTYAGLDRDVVVIGANTRLEIWDRSTWETYLAEQEPSFADLSEEVLPGVM
jgi:MraZ protein